MASARSWVCTAAYQAAKQYRDTDGARGLKVVQVGGTLRVPGAWLEEMADGPVDIENAPPAAPSDDRRSHNAPKPPSPKRRRLVSVPSTSASDTEQHPLPFTD